jgi:hypothetical protein
MHTNQKAGTRSTGQWNHTRKEGCVFNDARHYVSAIVCNARAAAIQLPSCNTREVRSAQNTNEFHGAIPQQCHELMRDGGCGNICGWLCIDGDEGHLHQDACMGESIAVRPRKTISACTHLPQGGRVHAFTLRKSEASPP